mmetsp:Transcript_9181/g.26231  ORF Transcript_9181/g.26231 Transcript_9181/m.26231 type:complete len:329 (+) Transcript_9181:131-1117(+)
MASPMIIMMAPSYYHCFSSSPLASAAARLSALRASFLARFNSAGVISDSLFFSIVAFGASDARSVVAAFGGNGFENGDGDDGDDGDASFDSIKRCFFLELCRCSRFWRRSLRASSDAFSSAILASDCRLTVIRFRRRLISTIRASTSSPSLNISSGFFTNSSLSRETWQNASEWQPISRKTPNGLTYTTFPLYVFPTEKSVTAIRPMQRRLSSVPSFRRRGFLLVAPSSLVAASSFDSSGLPSVLLVLPSSSFFSDSAMSVDVSLRPRRRFPRCLAGACISSSSSSSSSLESPLSPISSPSLPFSLDSSSSSSSPSPLPLVTSSFSLD